MKQVIERYLPWLAITFYGLYRWIVRTPDRAVEQAYRASCEIDEIVERYVRSSRPGSQATGSSAVNFYIQRQLQRRLKKINLRLMEFRASATLLPIQDERFLHRHAVVRAPQGDFCLPTNLHKITVIDEVRAKYSQLACLKTNRESTAYSSVDKSQTRSSTSAPPSTATEAVVLNSPDLAAKVAQAQHMHEVTSLLGQLVENEERLAKQVIGHLYDVATVNLIDRKVTIGFLNRSAKPLAGIVKPVAKSLGYVWLKRNCPELIAKWLNEQVSFERQSSKDVDQILERPEQVGGEINEIEQDDYTVEERDELGVAKVEIIQTDSTRLNQESHRQWLMGAAAGATAAIAVAALWLGGIASPPASEQVVDTTFESIEEPVEKKIASEGSRPSQAI